jgi:cholest-4-en-3-one 26-monooxygenase
VPRLDAERIYAEADALDLADIDLLADTWADRVPHVEFAKLRREAPVFWHEEPKDTGFFAITKHDDIVTISRDHETFSTELGGTFIPTQREEDLMQMRLSILNMDPPRHDRLRKLISAGFTPRQIRRLIAAVEEHADEIVDAIAERGEADFVADVASPLPLWMICEMLGIPAADWEQMRVWSDRMVGFDDPDLSVSPEAHMQAAIDMFTYCNDLVQKRQVEPADDILSTLVHAEVDGDRLNELELNLFFVTLVIAGNETTRNLISHGMLALFDHRDQMEKLQANPDLMPTAVDEMLRWGTSINNFRRTATRDTEVSGVPIAEGQKLVTYYLSANYDEDHFDAPFEFRVDRTPNEHVTFGGGGVHFCLGSHLAKAEIGATIGSVLRRLPDIELASEPERLRSDFINGIKQMPVRFTPRAARGAA